MNWKLWVVAYIWMGATSILFFPHRKFKNPGVHGWILLGAVWPITWLDLLARYLEDQQNDKA